MDLIWDINYVAEFFILFEGVVVMYSYVTYEVGLLLYNAD